MFDVALTREILSQIHGATQTILRRLQRIESSLDFTGSDKGWRSWMRPACS